MLAVFKLLNLIYNNVHKKRAKNKSEVEKYETASFNRGTGFCVH